MACREADLVEQLDQLGVVPGELIMVHASLRAVGAVEGGAESVARALQQAVGNQGTLMAYVSWSDSPYDATLNGRVLSDDQKARWPEFDPSHSPPYAGFGVLNEYLLKLPGSVRSRHPDASMWAVGPKAGYLVEPHELGDGYGPGSPLERFVAMNGKVLLLGAPPDSVTVLHYAEAIARIPGKRTVTYQVPQRTLEGRRIWCPVQELDSNGILDCYAEPGQMDAVEMMATDYLALGRHREGYVGQALCRLIDAVDVVAFGVEWLEARHG